MTIRNTLLAAAAVLVAATAGTATWAGQYAVSTAKGGAAINCSIPNNVVCTITSNKGVKSVKISANTPQGTVAVVDKSYRSCPKQVKVSWDSAYQSSNTQIVECSPMGLKAAN